MPAEMWARRISQCGTHEERLSLLEQAATEGKDICSESVPEIKKGSVLYIKPNDPWVIPASKAGFAHLLVVPL